VTELPVPIAEAIAPPLEPVSAVAPPPLLEPLTVNTQLQDRYVVLEIMRRDAGVNVYRVGDMLRCPSCGSENSLDEQFCVNCGFELTERGVCLLEERAAQENESVTPPAFVAAGRVYVVRAEQPSVPEKSAFPTGVRLAFGIQSDVGLVRGAGGGVDEDSVFAAAFAAMHESVAQPTVGLFIVADGIGGSAAGEVASRMCVQIVAGGLMQAVVAPVLAGNPPDAEMIREAIQAAVQNANVQILHAARERQNDMGTTITLALVVNDGAYIANVGDSRTYVIEDSQLRQITRDHSVVAGLVERGEIQPDEIYNHPQRNYILRSLGAKEYLDVDLFPPEGGALKLKPGMRLLLCCDGLWEMTRNEGIEEVFLSELDPQKTADKLVQAANKGGGEDNVSVVVVNLVR
jgi:protein phosphatase